MPVISRFCPPFAASIYSGRSHADVMKASRLAEAGCMLTAHMNISSCGFEHHVELSTQACGDSIARTMPLRLQLN